MHVPGKFPTSPCVPVFLFPAALCTKCAASFSPDAVLAPEVPGRTATSRPVIPLASSGFAAKQSQQPPSASHMSSKMPSGAASAVYRTQNANQPGAAAGLANPTGANHCFLNVLVQTLCHLPDFQQPLKAMGEAESSGSSSPSLIRALKALFSAMQGATGKVLPPDGLRIALMDDAVDCYQQIMSILVDPSGKTAGAARFKHMVVEMLEQYSCSCGTTSEPTPSVQSILYFPATALSSAKAKYPRHSFGRLLREVFITESARGCQRDGCKSKV
eukprot:gene22627-32816_t